MAVKWAVANGNWSAGATWNDGVEPTDGDVVYLNGHTVTFPRTLNIGGGTISNAICPNTGVSGGTLSASNSPVSVVANLVADSSSILTSKVNTTITGNVSVKNTAYALYRSGDTTTSNWTINGNVTMDGGYLVLDNLANMIVLVNGNLTATNEVTPIKNIYNFSINGNLTANSYNLNIGNIFTINGNLTANYCSIATSTANISGNIYYRSNNTTIGITWKSLNISNTSEWRDLTEPRSNPFIILTDAEMNNTNQYPSPANVKKDVPYAWGELVGQYLPDYPQEAVVLKDVVYDSGNKTGKLVVLPAELISRLLNCPTIETMQQLLIAHLNPETD